MRCLVGLAVVTVAAGVHAAEPSELLEPYAPPDTTAIGVLDDMGLFCEGFISLFGAESGELDGKTPRDLVEDVPRWMRIRGGDTIDTVGIDYHGDALWLFDQQMDQIGQLIGLSDPQKFNDWVLAQNPTTEINADGLSVHTINPYPNNMYWQFQTAVIDGVSFQGRVTSRMTRLLERNEEPSLWVSRFTMPGAGRAMMALDLAQLTESRRNDIRQALRFLLGMPSGSRAYQRELSQVAVAQAQMQMAESMLDHTSQVENLQFTITPSRDRAVVQGDLTLIPNAPIADLLPRHGESDLSLERMLPLDPIMTLASTNDAERNAVWVTALRVGGLEVASKTDEEVSAAAVEELSLMHFNLFSCLGDEMAFGLYPMAPDVPLLCGASILRAEDPQGAVDSLVEIQKHPLSIYTMARFANGEESDLTVTDEMETVAGVEVRHLTVKGMAGLFRRASSAGIFWADGLSEVNVPDWHCWLATSGNAVLMTHEPEPRLMEQMLTPDRRPFVPLAHEELEGVDLRFHLSGARLIEWGATCDEKAGRQWSHWVDMREQLAGHGLDLWAGLTRVSRGFQGHLIISGDDFRAFTDNL